MKLSSLHIYSGYAEKSYSCTVEFTSGNGKIQLNCGPELSAKIIAVCADAILEKSRETLASMTEEAIGSITQANQPAITVVDNEVADDVNF